MADLTTEDIALSRAQDERNKVSARLRRTRAMLRAERRAHGRQEQQHRLVREAHIYAVAESNRLRRERDEARRELAATPAWARTMAGVEAIVGPCEMRFSCLPSGYSVWTVYAVADGESEMAWALTRERAAELAMDAARELRGKLDALAARPATEGRTLADVSAEAHQRAEGDDVAWARELLALLDEPEGG